MNDLLIGRAQSYPPELRNDQLVDVPRIAFNIELVRGETIAGARLADIGGGLGLFSLGCALAGMDVTLIDDFQDALHLSIDSPALNMHRAAGVRILERDITRGLELERDTFDVVTCFEVLEHVHGGAARIVREMIDALRPGGRLILSGPNAVNLRKRVAVMAGRSNWSSFDSWYVESEFRGHVRELVLADLWEIASRHGLVDVQLLGRSWTGHRAGESALRRRLIHSLDLALRPFAQMASNLYLVARKPVIDSG